MSWTGQPGKPEEPNRPDGDLLLRGFWKGSSRVGAPNLGVPVTGEGLEYGLSRM